MSKPPFDQVQRQHVLSAIAEIDANGVPNTRRAKGFDVIVDGKTYPPKYLLCLAGRFATGTEFDPGHFSGGHETNSVLENLDFEVRARETQSIRDSLERIMQQYVAARSGEKFGAEHPLWNVFKNIKTALGEVEAISGNPNLVVRSSMGQGNWAKVPWIAILDGRETETTQRGVYCVFLFRQDMTGVYLTLAQGVTEPTRTLGAVAARDFMKKNAAGIRANLAGLSDFGFQLDDNIDLHADPGLGSAYVDSTIAYKFYEAGHVPDDDTLEADLGAVVTAYEAHVNATASDRKIWLFQANPDYYDLAGALAALKEQTWLVSAYRNEIREGNTVYLWESGSQGGLVGSATVIAEPTQRAFAEPEAPYIRNADKFAGIQWRALLRIDRVFEKRLLRHDLLKDDLLKNLAVIKMAQSTNFKVTPEEAARIEQLLGDSNITEPPPGTDPPVDPWFELRSLTFMAEEDLKEIENLLTHKKQIIFEGPPGSGKTYLAKLIGRHFAGLPLSDGPDPHLRIVQFHQSYAYEDFVEGIRPETSAAGQIEYNIRPGIFKRLCEDARSEPNRPYVIVIEYRNLQIELPYQKEGPLFSIPDNVYVIGTMNTTDRSLSQIDYALRRRFFFYRLMPVASGAAPVLRKWLEAKSGLSSEKQDAILKLFLNLNERIRKELGEHFQIGHSYFMNTEIGTDSGRKQVWDFAIMPLLEEYFYNRRDRASLLSEFAVDKLIKANDDAQAASA
jgi:hypothetical protein